MLHKHYLHLAKRNKRSLVYIRHSHLLIIPRTMKLWQIFHSLGTSVKEPLGRTYQAISLDNHVLISTQNTQQRGWDKGCIQIGKLVLCIFLSVGLACCIVNYRPSRLTTDLHGLVAKHWWLLRDRDICGADHARLLKNWRNLCWLMRGCVFFLGISRV